MSEIKRLRFSEGVSVSSPTNELVEAETLGKHASTAAFVTAKGSAAADGDIFYNTTSDLINYYSDGAWSALVDDDSAQTITNKTIAAGSNTISGLTHGNEVDDPNTGVHGVSGEVVGTNNAQTLSNKDLTAGSNFMAANRLTEGLVPDARIPSSNVTQHVGDIDHDSLLNYVANEHINWEATASATDNFATSGTAATGALGVTGNITVTGTVDGRDVATDGTNQDSHIAASTGVHGVTGSVVGTSDTQTLTNKTITDAGSSLSATRLTEGTVPDARIASSSVTQHEGSINHDALTNFVANEHIDWTSTSSNFSTTGSVTGADITSTGDLKAENDVQIFNPVSGAAFVALRGSTGLGSSYDIELPNVNSTTVGQVLTVASRTSSESVLEWGTVLTNPMDSPGDLIYGASGGTATKLDAGTANQVLQANGAAAPSWTSTPTHTGLTVSSGSSGDTADVNGDELVVEGSANAGISILAGTTSSATLYLGETGFVQADNSANDLFMGGSSTALTLRSGGNVEIPNGDLIVDTNTLFVDASANSVGFGTSTPGGKVHIEESNSGASFDAGADGLIVESSGGTGITIATGTSSLGTLYFADSGGVSRGYMYYNHSGDNMVLGVAGSDFLNVNSVKEFGIATSPSSGYRLNIFSPSTGDAAIPMRMIIDASSGDKTAVDFRDGLNTQCGTIVIDTTNNEVDYNTMSDSRLKTNVQDFNALNIITAATPKSYEKLSNPGTIHYGFLAQDLNLALPQAVKEGGEDENTDPWQVDYSKTTGVLWKAVQELLARIEALENA